MVGKNVQRRVVLYDVKNIWSSALVFINKIVLENGHVHLSMCCPWLLSQCKGRGEQLWQRLSGPQSLNYLTSCPSQWKCADSCLRTLLLYHRSDFGTFTWPHDASVSTLLKGEWIEVSHWFVRTIKELKYIKCLTEYLVICSKLFVNISYYHYYY